MRAEVPKVVAMVIMGAWGDSIEFDDYYWYVEPATITNRRGKDVFFTTNSFVLIGERISKGVNPQQSCEEDANEKK